METIAMSKLRISIITLLVIIAGFITLLLTALLVNTPVTNKNVAQIGAITVQPTVVPSIGVSPLEQDIANLALNYTKKKYTAKGTPQVLYSRTAKIADLPKLGFEPHPGTHPDHTFLVVILKGEFDMSNMPGLPPKEEASTWWQASYLGYVYNPDSKQVGPMMVAGSKTGGIFRQALNDPTLPDENPNKSPQNGITVQIGSAPTADWRTPTAAPGTFAPTTVPANLRATPTITTQAKSN
jgi:hypothetical protein